MEEMNNLENQPSVDETILENQPSEQNQVSEQQAAEEQRAKEVHEAQERNFKALREAREKAERRAAQAEQYAQSLERQYAQPKQTKTQLADDDIPEWKDVRSEIESLRQKVAMQNAELRLAAKYPDYQQVLSDENIETLRALKPELMASIESNTDIYTKAVSAMELMKTYGIGKKDEIAYERQKATANINKPRSTASLNPATSNSPLAQAHNFTGGKMTEAERKAIEVAARRHARGG